MFQSKVVEKIKTHSSSSVFYFENRAFCEIMWEKHRTAGHATEENTTQRMRIACWIPKATNTHSEYVIFVFFSTAAKVARRRHHITITPNACPVSPVCKPIYVHPISCSRHYLFNFFICLLFSTRTHLDVLGATHNPPRHTTWRKFWSLLYLPSCVCCTPQFSATSLHQH